PKGHAREKCVESKSFKSLKTKQRRKLVTALGALAILERATPRPAAYRRARLSASPAFSWQRAAPVKQRRSSVRRLKPLRLSPRYRPRLCLMSSGDRYLSTASSRVIT